MGISPSSTVLTPARDSLPSALAARGHAPVAQLDRAPDYGSGGWGFDFSRARHLSSISYEDFRRRADLSPARIPPFKSRSAEDAEPPWGSWQHIDPPKVTTSPTLV